MTRRQTAEPKCTITIEAPANGQVRQSTIYVRDEDGKIIHTDRADLNKAREREKAAARIAKAMKIDEEKIGQQLEATWNDLVEQHQRIKQQADRGPVDAPAAIVTQELLEAEPDMIRRPLSLIGGRAYAAHWGKVRTTTSRSVDGKSGQVTEHNPPLVKIEDKLLIVTQDGKRFAEKGTPDARPFEDLGLPVALPSSVPPGRGWSGAGVNRYAAGDRPDPTEVFLRVQSCVDHFLDFERSLASQDTMCELLACAIIATYFLEAFHVAAYLWPNGEAGSGKTTLLQVVTELGYLGQLILAGSSYPTLRDLADYGATLGFDDAEAVMDPKRTDPDKRTLLLAGSRRGTTVSVKELVGDKWVTRYVSTYSFRLFSAIRLPDPVLGSRTILLPLVRSGDVERTKRNPADEASWPCDRRRLVDDLWALGLANLPELRRYDGAAAARARLHGRNLEPWRSILAVALWLQECRRGVPGLFDRLEALSVAYQGERGDYESGDATRVLYRVLLKRVANKEDREPVLILPRDVAEDMNAIARDEDLGKPDEPFTTSRRVGWMFKRQRFRRPTQRQEGGKHWQVTRREIEAGARAYGIDPGSEMASGGLTYSEEPLPD
jgi:hypothetical protein